MRTKTNVGGWDRNARFMVGAAMLVAGALLPLKPRARFSLLMLGATNLLTASTRYCPLSEALGVNTASRGVGSELKAAAEAIAR